VSPIEFIEDVLRDPDNEGQPFTLYPAQRAFLNEGFTLRPDGRLCLQVKIC